jgi:hypothetical protein
MVCLYGVRQKGKGVSVSWHHARKAIGERMAANRRRYNEAPLRDALEAQAIRALAAPSAPVLSKEHFRPVERDGQTRWLLLPGDVLPCVWSGHCRRSAAHVVQVSMGQRPARAHRLRPSR